MENTPYTSKIYRFFQVIPSLTLAFLLVLVGILLIPLLLILSRGNKAEIFPDQALGDNTCTTIPGKTSAGPCA